MRPERELLYQYVLREWGRRAISDRSLRDAEPPEIDNQVIGWEITKYRRKWYQCIIEEASASALKDAEDRFVEHVMPVTVGTLKNPRDAVDGLYYLADVTCMISQMPPRRAQSSTPLVEKDNLVFLLNVHRSVNPSDYGFLQLCSRCKETNSRLSVVVYAGWVSYTGLHSTTEGNPVFETRLIRSPDYTIGHEHCKDRTWYMVSCSCTWSVTSERELAALDVMCTRREMCLLLTSGDALERSALPFWPQTIATKTFVEHMKRSHDISQIRALQVCTALCTSGPECKGPGSKDQPVPPEESILPVVLIQGPPGTGKTHTVTSILNLWLLYAYHCKVIQWEADCKAYVHQRIRGAHASAPALVSGARILVCAPSNAACDELLGRVMKKGFKDVFGGEWFPSIARIGSESATISYDAEEVCVERKVKTWLQAEEERRRIDKTVTRGAVREETKKRVDAKQKKMVALNNLDWAIRNRDESVVQETFIHECLGWEEWLLKCTTNLEMLEIADAYFNSVKQGERRRLQRDLQLLHLKGAEIVFTTLSGTRSGLFDLCSDFDLVLVDEAAQASEVATLQPLTRGRQGRCKLVLVGDHQQLPPTILGVQNREQGLEKSLFQRLVEDNWPVQVLTFQYRMHPHISRFPRTCFYKGELQDSNKAKGRQPRQFHAHHLLKPYTVFDVACGSEQGGESKWNLEEINMALALYQALGEQAGSENYSVGIISPYKEQCSMMERAFRGRLCHANPVKIGTVDGFQGHEMDVIIFSCVRANSSGEIGFLEDVRRMNVGLTRARHSLWILANVDTLRSSKCEAWRKLFTDASGVEGPNTSHMVNNACAARLFPKTLSWEPHGQHS